MAQFSYVAVTQAGKQQKGQIEAKDENAARLELKTSGLIPYQIAPLGALNKEISISITKPVKVRELAVFCRQFNSILNAGVTAVKALDMLSGQVENKVFKNAILETKAAVEKGETLADAMRLQPKIFPPLLVNMVEAGEASGSLEVALLRMATQFEKSAKMKALVKKASIYPIILMVVAFGVLAIMSVVVIPQFVTMFESMGSELPAITKFVMNMSNFVRTKWYIILLIIAAIIMTYKYVDSTPEGKAFLAKGKMKLPIFGKLSVKSSSAAFSRTLSTLVSSGISITQALDITARSMSNEMFRRAIVKTKEEAERGVQLSVPIKESGVFPEMVPQMVKIGEETGNIEGMLEKVAEYYEDEVEIATQGLSSAIEPLIIIVMAVIVGVIVMAIYMPMISMYKGLETL